MHLDFGGVWHQINRLHGAGTVAERSQLDEIASQRHRIARDIDELRGGHGPEQRHTDRAPPRGGSDDGIWAQSFFEQLWQGFFDGKRLYGQASRSVIGLGQRAQAGSGARLSFDGSYRALQRQQRAGQVSASCIQLQDRRTAGESVTERVGNPAWQLAVTGRAGLGKSVGTGGQRSQLITEIDRRCADDLLIDDGSCDVMLGDETFQCFDERRTTGSRTGLDGQVNGALARGLATIDSDETGQITAGKSARAGALL